MGNAFTKQQVPTHCKRCGRTYTPTVQDSAHWNIEYASGYATGLVCPRCQTPEDSLEAEVNTAEMKGATLVDWRSLTEQERADVLHDAIYQRAIATIKKHKQRAVMAGDTHLEVDPAAWAREAVDSWPGIQGQNVKVRASATALAADIITQVLGLAK